MVTRAAFPHHYAIPSPGCTEYGFKIADWANAINGAVNQGTYAVSNAAADQVDGSTGVLTLTHNATASQYQIVSSYDLAAYTDQQVVRSVGVWAKNSGTTVKNLFLTIFNTNGSHNLSLRFSIPPTRGEWEFFINEEQQYYGGTPGFHEAADKLHIVRATEGGAATNSWPAWPDGESLTLGNVYINPRCRPKFILRSDDGLNSNVVDGTGGGYPASGKNFNAILAYYGFRGTAFICPEMIGHVRGSSTYLTQAQVQTLLDAGWTVGQHTKLTLADGMSSGLCLLGPWGYWYSQHVTRGITQGPTGTFADRQVTSVSAATKLFTTKAAHKIVSGYPLPVQFYDLAIGGVALNSTYYAKYEAATTFSLWNDEACTGQVSPADFADAGGANWRIAGSAQDDSAIYAQLVASDAAFQALGFSGDARPDFLALPQGGWDSYVKSACERFGYSAVLGISNYNNGCHAIPVGTLVGGGNIGSTYSLSGWIAIPSAVQLDGALTAGNIQAFVDQAIKVGGTGSCYIHSGGGTNCTTLDALCAYLKSKEQHGLIDVVTLSEWFRGLTNPRQTINR